MVANKKEKDADFYNQVYLDGGQNRMYKVPYQDSPYFPIWKRAMEVLELKDKPKILELGCGVGQFAQFLFTYNIDHYMGIDYSEEAIKQAKASNPSYKECFIVDDIYQTTWMDSDYQIVILFEVLEHLEHDLAVLARIKKGSQVCLSVPNFDSTSHVRYFPTEQAVIARYQEHLQIGTLSTFSISQKNKLYLLTGVK
ncbi:class I SAM-dependent methyltransferase [Amphibacillus cookii]|uniref:class I SAM-dependent methyltransferase n=1 Tax=Amphibacillus cookii TaxID=767787 RepID=UPI00195E77B4|nr:class I SAM-dependent methyltransferase [Amphibacillus cookii]MBM7541971.1 2-polyprenyl-3-methyl-5-hydroxy-6-metoxy-1,4-benzoquinol methylase [Amphibacillus cookii]